MSAKKAATQINPMEEFLRMDRIPHIWCSGCGIGTVVTSFVEGVRKEKIDLDSISIVSGIGCTGRVAGYVKLDSFHTTHGRAIAFATGLKLGNPKQKPRLKLRRKWNQKPMSKQSQKLKLKKNRQLRWKPKVSQKLRLTLDLKPKKRLRLNLNQRLKKRAM